MRAERCGACRHFVNDPLSLERGIPGLSILSSAFGSVRADTGWCRLDDRFRVPRQGCPEFVDEQVPPDEPSPRRIGGGPVGA